MFCERAMKVLIHCNDNPRVIEVHKGGCLRAIVRQRLQTCVIGIQAGYGRSSSLGTSVQKAKMCARISTGSV